MIRSYTDAPVDSAVVDELIDVARRAPSAGNTQPWEVLVLAGVDVAHYWDTTLGDGRAAFRWQGLLSAPVLIIPYVRPDSYVERYAEADKASTGLGTTADAWTVPYWWIDGGAFVENLLLGATALGFGACLFGQFDHEADVRARFDVPDDRRALGTISIGHPAADEPGRSADRGRIALDEVVHRGQW